MSGGRLVVLDRSGRDVKRYSLPDGLVTLGSGPDADIRVMQPSVSEHHATVTVRANQTVIRNVSDSETLLNGRPISVATLHHGDTISLGDRSLRWEYDQPAGVKTVTSQPSLVVGKRTSGSGGRQRGGSRKRASVVPATRRLDPTVRLMIELKHRASMPGGAKQVAIVQPQRRDNNDVQDANPRLLVKPHRPYAQANKRQRTSKQETPTREGGPSTDQPDTGSKRKTTTQRLTNRTPDLQNTTKATLWIESRKSSPRRSSPSTPRADAVKPTLPARRAVASAKKPTPLRTVVLRKAMTPNDSLAANLGRKMLVSKVAKIQAPSRIDHTKQAALMLMTGRALKSKAASPKGANASDNITPKITPRGAKRSPRNVPKTPQSAQRVSTRKSKGVTPKTAETTPKRSSNVFRRGTKGSPENQSETLPEMSTSDLRQSRSSSRNKRQSKSLVSSPSFPSPKKSAMKDPRAKKGIRKNESIKFDLSNLVSRQDDSADVMIVSNNSSKGRSYLSYNTSVSETDLSLRYSDSSQNDSPSSRKSIHSRSSKIMEKALGTPMASTSHERSTLTPDSPSPKRSLRGDLMVQKVLQTPEKDQSSRYSRNSTKSVSDANTTILKMRDSGSPRSKRNVESYSIVDLVSNDSVESQSSSLYNSIRSESTAFGTPQTSGRVTRSTIDPAFLGSSTPYVAKTPSKASASISSASFVTNLNSSSARRSKSLTIPESKKTSFSSKRSSSLTTPENAKRPISINSTRLSRPSRRTLNDSDLMILSANEDSSPKTSKRKSELPHRSLIASPKSSMTHTESSADDTKSLDTSFSILTATSSRFTTSKSPRVSAVNSPRASRTNSPLVSAANSSKVSAYNSPRPSRTNSPRVSAVNSPRASRTNSSRVSAVNSPRASRTNSPRVSVANSSKVSAVNSPRVSRTNSPRVSAVNSPKVSRTNSPRVSAAKSSKVLAVNSPRASRTNSPRVSAANSPRASGTNSTRISLAYSTIICGSSPDNNKSPVLSTKKANGKYKRRSGKQISLTIPSSPFSDGQHTPENVYSPQEQGTPVLSIQSLLDSSDLSLLSRKSHRKKSRSPLKRKTIGATRSVPRRGRSGIKSKSLNLSAARKALVRISTDSSNVSVRTDEGAAKPTNEKTVTPISTVKLAQVAVKEKHSTAKKPQSKRSIIDNLNRSDIVKSLFNSPVKRKLSRSMVEFSRTQLFEEGDLGTARKRTRQTIAFGTSPDRFLLDRSEAFTPDAFVSPLTTPENSPNISGVNRFLRANTSKSGRGKKSLGGSSKSNEKGVSKITRSKRVSPKSPQVRITDFRGVKELFTTACSPANDLRRVSGVKSLFQTKRTRNSPKNDLTDVRGVKRLYRGRPTCSPRNDLRDVRGVKRLFARQQSKDGLDDLSGVEELFDTSFDSHKNSPRSQAALEASKSSESVFDQLLDKPRFRATYARSFGSKPAEKYKTGRGTKSLNVTFDSSNVDEWLENELQKRRKNVTVTTNVSTAKGRKSMNKSKLVARELANLATDTIEGSAPVRLSRSRNSSMMKSAIDIIERKSASQRYSANSLPIKKRSISQVALDKSAKKPTLPIKKRVLLHSTPVKGKFDETANGTLALGRVSPIVADKTDLQDSAVRIARQPSASPKSKPPSPQRKSNVNSPKDQTSRNISKAAFPKGKSGPVKRTRAIKTVTQEETAVVESPGPKKMMTRRRKAAEASLLSNSMRRRSSLVITKKPPGINPTNPEGKGQGRPVKGRRNAKEQSPKAKTPEVATKTTRSRAVKITTPKPSPKRTTRAKKASPNKITGSKKASPIKITGSKKASPNKTIGSKKASPNKTTGSKKAIPNKTTGRTKKTETLKQSPKNAAKPKTAATSKVNSNTVTNARVLDSPKDTVKRATRGKKVKSPKVITPIARPARATRGKKDTTKASPKEATASRGKKIIEKPVTPKTTRARKTKNNSNLIVGKPSPQLKPQAKQTRGKKEESVTVEQIPKEVAAKIRRVGGRKLKESPVEIQDEPKRGRKVIENQASSSENNKTTPPKRGRSVQTRGRNMDSSPEVKPKRGRSATVQASPRDIKRGRKRKASPITITVPEKTRRGKKPIEQSDKPKGSVVTTVQVKTQTRRGQIKTDEKKNTIQSKKIKQNGELSQKGRKKNNKPESSPAKATMPTRSRRR